MSRARVRAELARDVSSLFLFFSVVYKLTVDQKHVVGRWRGGSHLLGLDVLVGVTERCNEEIVVMM